MATETKWNDYSEKMVKRIPKGETVSYKLLGIIPDPENPGKFIIPASKNARATDIVYDPGKDDYVPIAFIGNVTSDGKVKFGDIEFTKYSRGVITLFANNPKHQKLYNYMEICNYNSSNSERNPSEEPVFYRVDSDGAAKVRRDARSLIRESSVLAAELTDDNVKWVLSVLGEPLGTISEMRDTIEAYAEKNPEEFVKLINQQTNRIESEIKDAISLQIITHNSQDRKFVWSDSGKEIYTYKKIVGGKTFKEFAEYLQKENPEELRNIQDRLAVKANP